MSSPSGVDQDATTVNDIDQAIAHLRESLRALDGDAEKQAIVRNYVDDLLEQRLDLTRA